MKKKSDTLVILTPGFPKNEEDTACVPLQQLFVKALKQVCPGLRVIVIAFQYPFFEAEYNWHGTKVIALGGRGHGKLHRVVTWRKAWKTIHGIKRSHNLLGLLSFWFGECAFIGNYFSKKYALTHYCWLNGQDARPRNKYFRWIRPRAETLIALSDFLKEEVRLNYGVKPLVVIPAGIEPSMFGSAPQKRDIDILGAGSLIPLKQYDLFIEVLAFARQSIPNIKAVICGKGPELQRLQLLSEQAGLTGNLTFAGELPHQEVINLMQRTKLFLHPSAYEGFGVVLAEALYAGAHVVSFCKPMNRNYRHHHVAANPAEMKNAVLKLLANARRGHDPVLICTIQQVATEMISLFAS